MYSFTVNDKKDSLTLTTVPTADGKFTINVTSAGKPHNRIVCPGGCVSYTSDGPQSFLAEGSAVVVWGVTGEFYYNRRITIDLAAGKVTYETWGNVAGPKCHDFVPLFSHDLVKNATPVYKVYKYKGAVLAKLQ